MPDSRETYRFRDVELDVPAYELRRSGRPIRLERRPMDLLILLLEHRNELVTRGDIIERFWGNDVFVDVEAGVHVAMRKLRRALRDSAESPMFVETVPGRGYRFIAPVEVVLKARPVSPSSRISLAVLPFVNIGTDLERHYLADGLTEETSASLAQIDPDRLSVKGRTLRYRDTTKSAAEIGRELSVDYLLESSIQADGDRLRVTAKLIRVRDQEYVWARSYDHESTSLLGLQHELGRAIAEQIRLRLAPEWPDILTRRQTQSADAYDFYLRARNLANQRTSATTRRAIDCYTRATSLEPNFALAWSGIADAYAASCLNGDAPPLAVGPPAREAAARAARADPNLSETQFAVAYVAWILDWDWPGAEAAFRRAIRLDAENARSHCCLGHLLSQAGRHDEARPELLRARELEALDPLMHALSSQVTFQARDYRGALEHARQAIVLDPEFWIGFIMRSQALGQMDQTDQALESLLAMTWFAPQNSKALSLRGYLLAKAGRSSEARDVLGMLDTASRTRYVPPYAMALVSLGLGDRDVAFAWLDRAYAVRDAHLMYLTVDPKWDPLRSDARFETLVELCGFRRAAAQTA
jgi:TolB-like protein/Flp pilus assembly protein TadD